MLSVPVTKTTARFVTDPTHVIAKTFAPGDGPLEASSSRIERIVSRIGALSDADVSTTLRTAQDRFAAHHIDLASMFEANFAAVAAPVVRASDLSLERRLLIGAYFTHEYSIEAAALCNPSIVPAPDQGGLAPGEQRFVLSLRAIGEGHISSIEFRGGVVEANGRIRMEPPSRFAGTAVRRYPAYDRQVFRSQLIERCAFNEIAASVLDALPDRFTLDQLEAVIRQVTPQFGEQADAINLAQATRAIHWLASSNYECSFAPDSDLSERVLFPAGPIESHGIEDARFVRFTCDDGTVTYFAPYTAFDGHQILPQLIETADFVSFHVSTLTGAAAKNKGIAFFPRMIDGRYAALSRLDNENNFLMWSDDVRSWHHGEVIQRPVRPWEITQIGNCGSPLETEAGWLVITHGVGALRQYAIGAVLLDKEDPARVIGHLAEPLLEPTDLERVGYVPNVVYSCGSMISGGLLVLPYGFSDVGAQIATVRLDDLLGALTGAR